MHRVLRIPEMTREIFSYFIPHLDPQGPSLLDQTLKERQGRRQAMRNCALACTAFLELSLDVLWTNMEDLSPLLHLLPEHAIVEDGEWKLAKAPNEQDWSRLKRYAPRVRFLRLHCAKPDAERQFSRPASPSYRSRFGIGFLRSLFQSWSMLNDAALLPNLRIFALFVSESSDFECCPGLMMSGLETATLGCCRAKSNLSDSSVEVFFNPITRSASSHTLRGLALPPLPELSKHHWSKPFPDSCLRMMCVLDSLAYFEFPWGAFKGEPFRSLRSYVPDEASGLKGITFPALRSIKVPLPDIHDALSFISGRNAITGLYTWFDEGHPGEFTGYFDFASAISRDCPHLTTLDIGMYNWPRKDIGLEQSIQTALASLLSHCKLLNDVRIWVSSRHDRSRVNPSDQDYLAISRSWVLLRNFFIKIQGYLYPEKQASRATLQGVLESFSTHCHELETLELRAAFFWNRKASPPSAVFSSLYMLDLGETMISSKQGTRSKVRPMGKHEVPIWKYVTAIANRAIVRVAEGPGVASDDLGPSGSSITITP